MKARSLSVVLTSFAVVYASWLVPSAQSAEVPQLVATLQSSSECPTASKWHMAMLEFFENSKGGTLPHGKTVENYRNFEMKPFLDGLATETGCALWADVDIYDMGSEVYPSDGSPSAINKTFISKGYDVVMYRYPDFGERKTLVGQASADRWIHFPVTQEDLTSNSPWISVIWHEWLHEVEFVALRKKLELGLPPDGVHYVFSSNPYYLNIGQNSGWWQSSMTFYKDLTAGRVPIEDKSYGITKKDWDWIGTPSHPRHIFQPVEFSTYANMIAGSAKVSFSTESTGQLTLTVESEPDKIIAQAENGSKVKELSFPLAKPGILKICIKTSLSSDEIWDSTESCHNVDFADSTPSLYAETNFNNIPSDVNPTRVIWRNDFEDMFTGAFPKAQIVLRQKGNETVFLKEYVDPKKLSWQIPPLPFGAYQVCLQFEGDTNECYFYDFEVKKKIPTKIMGVPNWVAVGGSFYVFNESREFLKFENLAPDICSSKSVKDYDLVTAKKSGNCKFRIVTLNDATYLPLDKVFSVPVVQSSKIKCQKGKALMYVTGFKPTCPTGYKKV